MKNFLLKSFWSISVLALAMLTFWTIGSKTFAYTDADYVNTVNPNPSVCTGMTAANVIHLTAGDIAGWGTFDHDMIYVLPAGNYTVAGNIQVASCSVLVTDGDTPGNAVLNFQWGTYISSNGEQNFSIRGFDTTHKLQIAWATSPGALLLQNSSWVTISYTILSGYTSFAAIMATDTTHMTIANNIISNNKDGIKTRWASTDNTITNNTITNNTNYGIFLQPWADNNIITNNTSISSNAVWWINLENANNCTISNNTISNHVVWLWVSLTSNTTNNTITNNTVSNNRIGIGITNAHTNTISNTTISGGVYWLYLDSNSSWNTFSSDNFYWSTTSNIYLNNWYHNTFTNTVVNGLATSAIGIQLENSHYNTFSGTSVSNNLEGTRLTNASNNTLRLTNNANWIHLYASSNSNNIWNTQALGQNTIFIYNGSNNIITGWLFTATSTTTSTVTINLKNDQTSPTYEITGAGLSGTYPTTPMTASTGTASIELTWGNGTKNITVIYNNGNTQYDSITLWTVVTPPTWGWGGWGGGWGWGGGAWIATCTSTQLVCSGGVRIKNTWVSCQWGNLGNSCSVSTGTLPVGSIVWSPYSTELNNAYLRAYSHGITTMNTIQKANMDGILIRAHMAKMISNFAITVAGLTPDTTAQCEFDDIANQSSEMKFYIKLSCQLGLMGLQSDGTPDTAFNPAQEVTRAQFGTILSRLIRANQYNGGTPYYTSHLNALKLAGIMTQITNPTTRKELRGYVMLMMQRTFDWGFLDN